PALPRSRVRTTRTTRRGRPSHGSTCAIISATSSGPTRSRGCTRSSDTPTRRTSWRSTGSCASIMPSITALADGVRAGRRVTADEALELYRRAPTSLLGRLADDVRARKHPERVVTYIIDRNVNYTNVCVAKCTFCAFYRDVGSSEGYVLGFDDLYRKI